MARVKIRRPFSCHCPPNQFEQSEHEQCFTGGQEQRRDDVARPMRTEINSRVTDGCGDNPVEAATPPIKQRAVHGDYRVVCHVSRWKRRSRAASIGLVGKTDSTLLKQAHEFRTRLLQFDHSHGLHLLGTTTINGRFQYACKQLPDQQRQEQAYHERPRFESAKKERAKDNRDEQRVPNLAIAQRRHEQVERRTRPLSVNEMKNRLVHSGSLKL